MTSCTLEFRPVWAAPGNRPRGRTLEENMKMTQPNQVPKATGLAAVCAAVLTVAGCGGGSDGASMRAPVSLTASWRSMALKYTTINVTLDGVSTPVRVVQGGVLRRQADEAGAHAAGAGPPIASTTRIAATRT
jgi:hypothetical protein